MSIPLTRNENYNESESFPCSKLRGNKNIRDCCFQGDRKNKSARAFFLARYCYLPLVVIDKKEKKCTIFSFIEIRMVEEI